MIIMPDIKAGRKEPQATSFRLQAGPIPIDSVGEAVTGDLRNYDATYHSHPFQIEHRQFL